MEFHRKTFCDDVTRCCDVIHFVFHEENNRLLCFPSGLQLNNHLFSYFDNLLHPNKARAGTIEQSSLDYHSEISLFFSQVLAFL